MYILLKNLLLIIMLLPVFTGCGKDKTPEERRLSGQQQVSAKNAQVEEPPHNTPFAVYYKICLEEDRLTMYEVTELGAECISSVKIDESYYPPEDISELRQGVRAYSKEGAYEIMENFTN